MCRRVCCPIGIITKCAEIVVFALVYFRHKYYNKININSILKQFKRILVIIWVVSLCYV